MTSWTAVGLSVAVVLVEGAAWLTVADENTINNIKNLM